MFDLLEPEDVVPEWKRWSAILLRPEGLYDTRPAEGGNKATKLKAIREALRTANLLRRVEPKILEPCDPLPDEPELYFAVSPARYRSSSQLYSFKRTWLFALESQGMPKSAIM